MSLDRYSDVLLKCTVHSRRTDWHFAWGWHTTKKLDVGFKPPFLASPLSRLTRSKQPFLRPLPAACGSSWASAGLTATLGSLQSSDFGSKPAKRVKYQADKATCLKLIYDEDFHILSSRWSSDSWYFHPDSPRSEFRLSTRTVEPRTITIWCWNYSSPLWSVGPDSRSSYRPLGYIFSLHHSATLSLLVLLPTWATARHTPNLSQKNGQIWNEAYLSPKMNSLLQIWNSFGGLHEVETRLYAGLSASVLYGRVTVLPEILCTCTVSVVDCIKLKHIHYPC